MRITGLRIHRTYAMARSVAELIAGLGGLLVAVGVAAAIYGLLDVMNSSRNPFAGAFSYWLIAGGIGAAVTGLLQVAAGQMLRASIDSAEYARQALILQVAMAQGRSEANLLREPDWRREPGAP